MTRHSTFILITLALTIKHYLDHGIVAMFIMLAGVSICGSMIFFSRLWAKFIIPLGFSATNASDYSHASDSAPAVVFLGWVLFLGICGYIMS